MEYHEAASFLLGLRRFGSKPGTESVADLLEHLDDPHEDVAFVQIAGSNGKGSTARMVESTLRQAGLNVGLYISPHLDDLRERIRINGRYIPKREIVAGVEAIREWSIDRSARGEPPTFFEAMTAIALRHFGSESVDVAVLEVGLGGRYDATSVVDPIASCVTTVSLEHTSVLGDTVEEIARDKACVAPADAPLVTGATGNALDAIREQVDDIVTVGDPADDPDIEATYGGRSNHVEAEVSVEGPDWSVTAPTPLIGSHQAQNAGVAAALVRQVADLDSNTIERGIRAADWPGRFEVIETEPLVILDGAHNPGACETLTESLAEFEYDELHLVFGAMHDKDVHGMVDALPTPDRVVVTQPDIERAADRAVLARVFERAGVEEVLTRNAVAGALQNALAAAEPGDAVVATGSLMVVAEARTRWSRVRIPSRVDDLDDARKALKRSDVTKPGIWRMRGKAVHRVVRTRVQPRQARYLKEELLSLGGECSVSGLADIDQENVEVTLSGTLAQFNRLIDKLDGQPYGLSVVGDEIRRTLRIRVEDEQHGYPWDDGTAVMGILNVTPDSFHDGGDYESVDDAVAHASEMADAGAAIIDVGGESTRPGADPVPADEEQARVVPVIERLTDLDAAISIDTRKASVAEAALDAGADIINDVSGLSDPRMRFVAAEYDVPLVVMHSISAPVDPGRRVVYDDVVEDVIAELSERVLLAEKAGVDRSQILIDPGLGFGKASHESFELVDRLSELRALDCPIMVGHSHKSMFDRVGRTSDDRSASTIALTALAADRGADVIRVHDVAENVDAVRTVVAATKK